MLNITKEIINKALDNDIINIIKSKGIKLRKAGKEYKARCPFHEERTPSFFVNPTKKVYHCFGCEAKGNVITFLVKYENYTFIDAIEYLLKSNGSSHLLENIKTKKTETLSRTKLLNRIMEFYHRTFKNSPTALNYIAEQRKIKNSQIYDTFKIGYADGSLLKVLSTRSKIKADLKKLRLITKRGTEFFKGCIVFPVLDANNNCVNMYGRKITPNGTQHLYLPGPNTGVFNRLAVKRDKDIILSESIIDALSGIANGYTNIIPVYGTNGLTDEHIKLFKEYNIKKIIFAFDNDRPGNEAIPRIIYRLKNLPVEFKKIILPEKQDLNEYFKTNGNGKFKQLIDEAEAITIKGENKQQSYKTEINGDEILFNTANIKYTVRGLNLYGFSRMKVNVRARKETMFHIDTIDLYASKSRTTFINQCSRRFEMEYKIIENDIFYLIRELERIRDEHIKAEESKNKIEIPEMTEAGKKEAIKFLLNKNLVNVIIKDISLLGYIGEEINKVIGYIVSVSRKLQDPLACIVLSRSGAGKSALIEKLELLTPPEDLIQFSNLTPQALYYMDKDELVHKLLLIEDRAGSEQADYSIRELQTKKVLRKGVPIKDQSGKIRTMRLEVNGPIAFMESTTNHNINPENMNRCFILHIDESPKQTKLIQQAQRKSKTIEGMKQKLIIPPIIKKHHNAQRLLKPVSVINPFSELINFPCDLLRTRRDHFRFLNLIEAITFLYQYQRKVKETVGKTTGEVIRYVESTIEDYKIAYRIIQDILDTTLDDLPKNSRDLLNMINEYVKRKSKKMKTPENEITFTRREIREFTKWSNDQIKNHIRKLEEMEYLYIERGTKGQQYLYRLLDGNISNNQFINKIPTPKEIEKKLKSRKKR